MTDRAHDNVGRVRPHSSMALRILASLAFVPCFIIITRRGDYHLLALVDLVIAIGLWEFYAMVGNRGVHAYRVIGIACGLTLSWYMFFRDGMYANLFLTLALLSIMVMELTRRATRSSVFNIAATIFGVLYVSFLASHIVLLRELPRRLGQSYSDGSAYVFLAFVTTWSCDTGAYFVGSVFGRHPLLPRVSENKTWEGAIGGVLFAVAGAVAARYTFAGFLTTPTAIALGAAAALVGILGDLVESMIKRDSGIKDASGTIPGHGGVLDRFDSLLFTAPLIYYFLKFVIYK